MSNKRIDNLIKLFKEVNQRFLIEEKELILSNVNERTLCGALSQYLTSITSLEEYKNYHVDVEYNRNDGKIKTIINENLEVVSINCDIIIHSRGANLKKDNLIAIEMKKSSTSDGEKQKDRQRLIALTKDSFDDIWSYDGKTLPKHVCGYDVGIYYEINVKNKNVLLEYFIKGEVAFKEEIEIT